jgi:hypothetical protein
MGPSEDSEAVEAGRLGNVTAALLFGGGGTPATVKPAEVDRVAGLLDGLFEELLRVGGDPASSMPGRHVALSGESGHPEKQASPLSLLSAALGAASCARVLAIPADRPAPAVDLWLALTAWPERAAVIAFGDDADRPLAALYRSEDILPILGRPLADDRGELGELLGRVEVERVTLEVLGLEASGHDSAAPDLETPAASSVLPEGS